jgi:hypothetical protein
MYWPSIRFLSKEKCIGQMDFEHLRQKAGGAHPSSPLALKMSTLQRQTAVSVLEEGLQDYLAFYDHERPYQISADGHSYKVRCPLLK